MKIHLGQKDFHVTICGLIVGNLDNIKQEIGYVVNCYNCLSIFGSDKDRYEKILKSD